MKIINYCGDATCWFVCAYIDLPDVSITERCPYSGVVWSTLSRAHTLTDAISNGTHYAHTHALTQVKPQVPSASHPPPLRQPVNRACGLLPATRRREGGLGSIEDVACVDSNKTEWATETRLGVTREGHSLENASSVLGKRLARVLGKHLKGPWEMHRAIHEKRVLHPRVYLSLARQQQEEETGEEGEEKEVEEASEVYILRCVLSPVADVNSEKSKTDHALPTTNEEIVCMSPEAADSDSTGEVTHMHLYTQHTQTYVYTHTFPYM